MKITKATLRGACSVQLKIFIKEWPNGAEITLKNCHRAVTLGLDLNWLSRKVFQPLALAEYEKARAPALAEHQKVTAPAWAEYYKAMALAWAEYEKARAPALAEYRKATAPALAEYEKARALALAEYLKATAPALAECQKAIAIAFHRAALREQIEQKEEQ